MFFLQTARSQTMILNSLKNENENENKQGVNMSTFIAFELHYPIKNPM